MVFARIFRLPTRFRLPRIEVLPAEKRLRAIIRRFIFFTYRRDTFFIQDLVYGFNMFQTQNAKDLRVVRVPAAVQSPCRRKSWSLQEINCLFPARSDSRRCQPRNRAFRYTDPAIDRGSRYIFMRTEILMQDGCQNERCKIFLPFQKVNHSYKVRTASIRQKLARMATNIGKTANRLKHKIGDRVESNRSMAKGEVYQFTLTNQLTGLLRLTGFG